MSLLALAARRRAPRHALGREFAELSPSARQEFDSIAGAQPRQHSLESQRILAGQTAQIV